MMMHSQKASAIQYVTNMSALIWDFIVTLTNYNNNVGVHTHKHTHAVLLCGVQSELVSERASRKMNTQLIWWSVSCRISQTEEVCSHLAPECINQWWDSSLPNCHQLQHTLFNKGLSLSSLWNQQSHLLTQHIAQEQVNCFSHQLEREQSR